MTWTVGQKKITNEQMRKDLLRAARQLSKFGNVGPHAAIHGPPAFVWKRGHKPKAPDVSNLSPLAAKITLFCIPEISTWRNGYGTLTGIVLKCPADPCQGELALPTTAEFEHGVRCPLMLLRRLGDGPELRRSIARRAGDLDYQGGGYSSCPICGGRTEWQKSVPKHEENCPGQEARSKTP